MAATTHIGLITLVAVATLAGAASPGHAAVVRVGPKPDRATIAGAISAAQPGDTILVGAGVYTEHGLVLDKPVVLAGVGSAVIDGDNQGEILVVTAGGASVKGLVFRNVGTSFIEDRAAIRIRRADRVTVEGNRLENTFFGIYAEHSQGLVARGNVLVGPGTRETTTGNGIHLWYCNHATIENNEIRGHRDGIYFEFVEDSQVTGNLSTHNLRYGLHFMFSHGNSYVGNRFIANGAGVAVMYTEHVVMRDNVFEHNWGSSSYGLLLKDIRRSEIQGNHFISNTVGLYSEGSEHLTVSNNEFVNNGYAIRVMANSTDNTFSYNNFTGNTFDVATNSRQNFNVFDSNYWSRYQGYDLDGDGIGDVPYHPVGLFSLLVEQSPPGIVVMESLFITIVDTAERVIPVFTPETLVDKRPLMTELPLGTSGVGASLAPVPTAPGGQP